MNKTELKETLPIYHLTKELKEINKLAAIKLHNEAVKMALKKAEKGNIINLTDLMASKEELTK